MESYEHLLAPAGQPTSVTSNPAPVAKPVVDRIRKGWTVFPAFILSLILTGSVFLALWPVNTTFLGALFWQQGFFGPVVTWIAFYAVASLLVKSSQIQYQRRWLQNGLLPHSIGERIDFSNARQFLHHLEQSDHKSRSLVVHRLKSGLRHFIAKKSSQEVSEVLSNHSEIDAHNSHASFSTIRLIIWMLPILGFIGTVYGIGGSVSGFSGAINAGSNIDAIKDSLGEVTTGLGTSFNTTLLALILSIAVMIPKNIVQKSDESLLVSIELFCQQHLCLRLDDLISADGSNPAEFVDAFEKVLCHYQSTWADQCSKLAFELGQKLASDFDSQLTAYQNANDAMFGSLSELAQSTNRESASISQTLLRLQQEQSENLSPLIDSIKTTALTVDRQFSSIQPKLKLGTEQLELLSQFQDKLAQNVANQFRGLKDTVSLVGEKLTQSKPVDTHSDEVRNAMRDQSEQIVNELRLLRAQLQPQQITMQQPMHSVAPTEAGRPRRRRRSFISHLFFRENPPVLMEGQNHGTTTT